MNIFSSVTLYSTLLAEWRKNWNFMFRQRVAWYFQVSLIQGIHLDYLKLKRAFQEYRLQDLYPGTLLQYLALGSTNMHTYWGCWLTAGTSLPVSKQEVMSSPSTKWNVCCVRIKIELRSPMWSCAPPDVSSRANGAWGNRLWTEHCEKKPTLPCLENIPFLAQEQSEVKTWIHQILAWSFTA